MTNTEIPLIATERVVVPNVFPVIDPAGCDGVPPVPYRLAIVGEAPGEHEEKHGYPFVGPSGQLLDGLLDEVGIDRKRIFVGNVCQNRPPGNDISRFKWFENEIQNGIRQLRSDLLTFQPHLVVLLGNAALHVAKTKEAPPWRKTGYAWPYSISAWCKSLFVSQQLGFKCVAGFHPAAILRQWGQQGNYPRLREVLKLARVEGETSTLVLPQRDLRYREPASVLCHVMDTWPSGLRCSVDIEGGLPYTRVNLDQFTNSERRHLNWRCVSLSGNPSRAFAIAWWRFTPDEHERVLASFVRLMYRADVPKVFQNGLYDLFVLAHGYDIVVRGVAEDTMLKGWEVFCELPKGLSCQASVYTREPHWKDDEMYETTGDNLALGCCKDTAVTLEICNTQDALLDSAGMRHYRRNVDMITGPVLFMEMRGIRYDQESANARLRDVRAEMSALGDKLSEMAGFELRGDKGCLADKRLAYVLYQQAPYEYGPKNKRKSFSDWKTLPYPPQYKKEDGQKTDKLTTDVEALLRLRRQSPDDTFLSGLLRHRHLEGLAETLSIIPDADGRVRCGYNVVGTETGRLTCYKSPTGSGASLHTITKSLRSNYCADPGYDFFQCDLAGADGWTVAAHCSRLGDETMLADYLFGLKPAKILALLYGFGPDVNQLDRDSLAYWTNGAPWKEVVRVLGGGLYDSSKATQHGSNYLMGIPTMQTTVMKKTFKETGVPVYMEHRDGVILQRSYFSRYPGLPMWHQWAERELRTKGTLTSASGHTRIFFGPRWGKRMHDTVKEFLADEPQQNTTWATNLAMLRLWEDPDNRVKRVDRLGVETVSGQRHFFFGDAALLLARLRPGSLLIEPLHQVHDALCGQWPICLRDWARAKVRSYFNNTLTIAGHRIVIPFDGAYGPSWGACSDEKNPAHQKL